MLHPINNRWSTCSYYPSVCVCVCYADPNSNHQIHRPSSISNIISHLILSFFLSLYLLLLLFLYFLAQLRLSIISVAFCSNGPSNINTFRLPVQPRLFLSFFFSLISLAFSLLRLTARFNRRHTDRPKKKVDVDDDALSLVHGRPIDT